MLDVGNATDGPVEADDASERPQPKADVRWPEITAIAGVLIILNTGWIANSEMKTGVTEVTISTLFIGVTFLLFLITLANLAFARFFGQARALRQPEMMMLYSLLSMSSVVAGVGNMGFFTPFLTNAYWYATSSNGWRTWLYLLPWYIGPRSPAVLDGFYRGRSTFFTAATMHAWAAPLGVWTLFFLALIWTTMCMAVIVRRRWEEDEHLPFPVIALPLEMTVVGAPIYRNRLLWSGFAIPCALHSLNSLHSLNPLVPSFPINSAKDLLQGLGFPWNSMSWMFGGVHACGVGLGYLIDTDVLFSLWFFYLLRKVVNLIGVLQGWRDVSPGVFNDGDTQFPYLEYVSWGAWLALGVAVLWQGRAYFKAYLRRALRFQVTSEDRDEPISARTAVFGFIGGFLFLCCFVWTTGGSWWLPIAFFAVYAAIMLALTRLESETAVLSPYLVWVNPQSMIAAIGGTTALSRLDTVHLGILSCFNNDYRAAAMPHQLQAFVGQRRAGGSMHRVVAAMMIAAAFSVVCALLWDLQMYYTNGAETAHVNQWRITMGSTPWNYVESLLAHPKAPSGTALLGIAAGAGITVLLSAPRSGFPGFILAPAGFVLNTSWANDLFWLDMFIAWALKSVILRYGGIKFYRQALPFFLGLILGDFVTGSVWSIVGTALKQELFRTFST